MLKVGDDVPKWHSNDQNGDSISSSDFAGKRYVMYFYPKDMTPGCTVQAKNLNENLKLLKKEGYEIIGVSADSVERHCKFTDKHDLQFPLVADTEKEIIQAFGVWGKKKFMGKVYDGIHRVTFIINKEGIVERVIDKVKTKSHSAQILGE